MFSIVICFFLSFFRIHLYINFYVFCYFKSLKFLFCFIFIIFLTNGYWRLQSQQESWEDDRFRERLRRGSSNPAWKKNKNKRTKNEHWIEGLSLSVQAVLRFVLHTLFMNYKTLQNLLFEIIKIFFRAKRSLFKPLKWMQLSRALKCWEKNWEK